MRSNGAMELKVIFEETADINLTGLISPRSEELEMFSDSDSEGSSEEIKNDLDIYDCISQFRKVETLEDDNQYYCSNCKAFKDAKKNIEISKLPLVLILHLKRFKHSEAKDSSSSYYGRRDNLQKIKNMVDFPIEGLDMT